MHLKIKSLFKGIKYRYRKDKKNNNVTEVVIG